MIKTISFPVIAICVLMLCISSCEKKYENSCGVDNPVKDLVWLSDQIEIIKQMSPDHSKYYYFSMGTYNGQTVFIPGNCDPAANVIYVVLDCSGERIGFLGNIDDMIPWDDITDRQVIWQPENSACVL